MCGIAGILINNQNNEDINFESILKKMGIFIKNRGPDSSNKWISKKDGIAMLHTRLAIIGLGISGNQPMISHDGRYVMSFNGEIYNYKSIRNDLNNNFNIKWSGESDSEVLLEGISLLGLEKMITKLNGMYAIALWDKKLKILTLIRDRIGEKPIYFGTVFTDNQESIVFSSDIGSFTSLSSKKLDLEQSSVSEFLNNGWINGPKTIYKDIFKVDPGEYINISFSNLKNNFEINKKKYWSIDHKCQEKYENLNFDDTVINLKEKLINVLKDQLYSERKMAIFLSGGIDSTLLAVLAKKELGENINCLTCGFEDKIFNQEYDETDYARNICNFLKLPHSVKRITSNDVIEILPKMASIFSEPFADISQIGSYLISKKAKELDIVVAIGGDGGDELFGGYERYLSGNKLLFLKNKLPDIFFKLINFGSSYFPEFIGNGIGQLIGISEFNKKLDKFSYNIKNFNDLETLYLACISKWNKSDFEKLGVFEFTSFKENKHRTLKENTYSLDPRLYMMLMDLENYLVDDVLVKTDRTSMHLGLEIRAPFLDHKIINFANNIPVSSKFSFGKGKLHLRSILDQYISHRLLDRPKKGFSMPIDSFLRTTLKEWSGDMLNDLKNNNEIILDKKLIDKIWSEHLSCVRNHGNSLWNLITLSSWMNVWR